MVQALPSSQFVAPLGTQLPPEQVSPAVQALPSLHATVLFWCAQPVSGSHASEVQKMLSSQLGATPPTQLVSLQVSAVVQALPSEHAAVLARCTQPSPSAHESLVQMLPSSQPFTLPEHTPFEHVSLMLQTWPSSHNLPLSLVNTQPIALSQVSIVHGLLSLHVGATPPRQAPPPQVSLVVHALLSLHALALLVNTQPVALTQVSVVQPLVSSHGALATPLHVPWLHASSLVHASLSLHAPVTGVCTQPLVGLQLSSVQTLLSSQTTGVVVHVPATQVSPLVQASPSVHSTALSLVYWQPPVVSHSSVVQGLPSLQFTAVKTLQLLAPHVSPAVQALLSLQVTSLARKTQPPARSSQELSVHGLLSSQPRTAPRQTPWLHASAVLQALPSSQARPSASTWTQPLVALQLSVVHGLLSSQPSAGPAVQRGPEQVSPFVQALPSSQFTTVSAWMQPSVELHESAVQALPSSQFVAAPAWQLPSTHVSLAVQALPSEQPPVNGVVTQPWVLSQVTLVH